MVYSIHSDSTGTIFRIWLTDPDTGGPLDLTGYSVLQINFKKPDETTVTKTASLFGPETNGAIQYVGQDTEFDLSGDWRFQGLVVIPSGKWHSDIADFVILPNLVPAT